MSKSPWTDLEPQPGDFDEDLETIDSRYISAHRGVAEGQVRIVVSVEGDDAKRLQRVAAARGETPSEVIAKLLRAADSASV